MSLRDLVIALKGGAGSGNFGHSGRPGKIGGSSSGGGGMGGGGSHPGGEAFAGKLDPAHKYQMRGKWAKDNAKPGEHHKGMVYSLVDKTTGDTVQGIPQVILANTAHKWPKVLPSGETSSHMRQLSGDKLQKIMSEVPSHSIVPKTNFDYQNPDYPDYGD